MKNRFFSRFWTLMLAFILTVSFANCAAAPNEEGGMDGYNDFYSKNESVAGLPSVGTQNSGSSDKAQSMGDPTDDGLDVNYGGVMTEAGAEMDAEMEAPMEEMVPEGKPSEDIVYIPSFVENPFINTSENNVSTFSADVDTASYSYFRKLINSGYGLTELKNSGTAFRTEEFINYFKYNVSTPAENELFGVHTEIIDCPWNTETMLFRITLQAEKAENNIGNNLVFLIDVSGSMSSRDKLPLLKEAFAYLVDNLDENDTVSVVTYSGREAVVLQGCQGSKGETIMNVINNLNASGSTNGEAGLTMAYRIAEEYFIEGGNNRIIMASDGDLNVGISSASELTKYIEEKRDQGIYLSVLGFGTGNYRDNNMEALADNGNGVYYYIDGLSEAEKVFGTDLLGTLYTVAEDVKLQIEFNSAVVESYRLVGYENRMLQREDFEDDTKDAGEVGSSHQVTVCYEVKLGQQVPGANTLMTLRVRYKNPGEPISLLNEYPLGYDIISGEADEDMRFISAVIETCMILHNSEHIGNITVESVIEELESLDLSDYPERAEFLTLLKTLAK